jgi:hypothetical protein
MNTYCEHCKRVIWMFPERITHYTSCGPYKEQLRRENWAAVNVRAQSSADDLDFDKLRGLPR